MKYKSYDTDNNEYYCYFRKERMSGEYTQSITKDEILEMLMNNEHPLEPLITHNWSTETNENGLTKLNWERKPNCELPCTYTAIKNSYQKRKHKKAADKLRRDGVFGMAFDYDAIAQNTAHWSSGKWGMLIKKDWSNTIGHCYYMITQSMIYRPSIPMRGIEFETVEELVDCFYDILNGRPVNARAQQLQFGKRSGLYRPTGYEYCEPFEFIDGLASRKEFEGDIIQVDAA